MGFLSMFVFAIDLGGTNLRFAVYNQSMSVVWQKLFYSSSTTIFQAISSCLSELSAWKIQVQAACVAVAGPVVNGKARITNLGISIDNEELEKTLGVPVLLVNDFEAVAYGIQELTSNHYFSIQYSKSSDMRARKSIAIGPGTGLGVAEFFPDKQIVYPRESGNSNFPIECQNDLQLARFVSNGFMRAERIISGPGISKVYQFLSGNSMAPVEIVQKAMDLNENADGAIAYWISLFGRFCGNLALELPESIYIVGNIAPGLLRIKRYRDAFVEAFNSKGEFSDVTKLCNIRVVTIGDALGHMGAAVCALKKVQSGLS